METFPKPLFMKQIFAFKTTSHFTPFYRIVILRNPKALFLFKVVGTKVYDKDGAVDILLQHSTTGVIKIIYLNIYGTQLS